MANRDLAPPYSPRGQFDLFGQYALEVLACVGPFGVQDAFDGHAETVASGVVAVGDRGIDRSCHTSESRNPRLEAGDGVAEGV
ncbi:MAG TPA: hypothetical protein VGS19_03005, partial [Streptosporangiaceae bacterium]|nr:hypothetical protein [Streptosporangiaceae bacterium]